jgi:hypothetical protein
MGHARFRVRINQIKSNHETECATRTREKTYTVGAKGFC